MNKELIMENTSLPIGWEMKELGEIADVEYGFTDKSTIEGDYRYVRITDIDANGELIESGKKYIKYSKDAEGFLIKDNALLMARTGATFAKVLLYKDLEPSVFASYLIKIEFKEEFENALYWYFSKTKSYWEQANKLSSGAAQPHFNGKAVKQVIFPYPKSLPQQKQIVAILDKAFAAIDTAKVNAEQNLQNAKELFESYLQNVFENKGDDWEEKSISDFCKIGDGNYSSKYPKASDFVTEGVPFLTPSNVKRGTIVNTKLKYITTEQHSTLKKGHVLENDLVVVVRGFTSGNSSLVPKSYSGSNMNSQMALLRISSSDVNYQYFYYAFNSPPVQKLVKKSISGTNQLQLTNTKLLKVVVPLPPLTEQLVLIDNLEEMEFKFKNLVTIYDEKNRLLDELKKSILQKAFSGQLNIIN